MIERIENTAGFEKLREEWASLLEASASNSLFLTWEWLSTWWRHLSERRGLFLLAARRDGELVAMAPLALRPCRPTHLRPFRSLEFLGTGSVGSDYLDVVIRRGGEPEAQEALAGYLAEGRIALELAQLRTGACAAAELASLLRQRGWSALQARTDVCPFIPLAGHTWQSYLATLGPAHRYNFQRRLKNLSKHFDVRFERVVSEAQRREALALLVRLHNMRWQGRGGSTAFHTAGLLSFHNELSRLALDRNWLRLFVLRLNGEPAASLYGFRYGRTFYFYQSGFDPRYSKYSVGLVTMGLAIRSAIEEGVDEYDLLHGDEAYKFDWGRDTRELTRVRMYPPDVRGFMLRTADGLSRAAGKMVRRVLPRRVGNGLAGGQGFGAWRRIQTAWPR